MTNPSMTNPSTASPPVSRYLARAAWQGNLTGVRYFLKRLKVEEEIGGRTPLLWAISGGHEGVMDLLLQKGASLDKRTGEGASALTCAVWSGNAKLVQKLMDGGFAIEEKDHQGKSALDWAREMGNLDVLQILSERAVAASRLGSARKQEWLRERARRQRTIRPAP